MNHRTKVVGVVALVAVGGAIGGAVATVLGGSDRHPKTSASTEKRAQLNAEGRELIALLEEGKRTTYHAKYAAFSDDPAARGQSLVVEIWRKPPLARQDTRIEANGLVAHSAAYILGDRTVSCSRTGAGPWSCQESAGASASGGAEELTRQIAEQVAGHPVTARDDTVGGRAVRCFSVELATELADICVTPQGIPVLLKAASSRFELVELATGVPEEIFTPPAASARAFAPTNVQAGGA